MASEFLEPLDRELFFVIVIFSEEIAVFATKVAAVGYVDGSDRKLRAEDEEFGDIAELAEFTTNIHRRSLCDRIYLLSRALDCYLLLFVGVDLDLSARFDDRILPFFRKPNGPNRTTSATVVPVLSSPSWVLSSEA